MVQRTAPAARATTVGRAKASGRAVEALQNFVETTPSPNIFRHKVTQNDNGSWTLKIGKLERVEKKFMALTVLALREGSIKNIDAGLIAGPKVLPLLSRLRSEAEKAKIDVTVTGELNAADLKKAAAEQQDAEQRVGAAKHWSADEVTDFNRALKDFKLDGKWAVPTRYRPFELQVSGGKSKLTYGY